MAQDSDSPTIPPQTLKRWFSKGYTCFVIAALYELDGTDVHQTNSLARPYRDGAAHIQQALRPFSQKDIANAMRIALGAGVTSPISLTENHASVWTHASRIAHTIRVPSNLEHSLCPRTDMEKAVCIIAAAYCRKIDYIDALKTNCPAGLVPLFEDAAALSSVMIAPGTPSELRRQLKNGRFFDTLTK